MIKITRLSDIWKAANIPRYIAVSMEEQLFALCREWQTEDIADFGAFWFVESKEDLDNYRITGMTERIETATPEWITVLVSSSGERCQQVCHIIDESLAIYVFCEEKFLSGFLSEPVNN